MSFLIRNMLTFLFAIKPSVWWIRHQN